jgi:hypothetical protein
MNILHILNGDSTARSFEYTGLDGDLLVWREVLSEGPVEANIASGSFWRNRLDWICGNANESPENYQRNVLDHLAILDEPYDELNLWFEFDLHCQVNMLGVLAYLKQKTDLSGPAIFLICPTEFPGKENFRGMGELDGDELDYLYDNIRFQLSVIDFVVAAEAWEIYVSNNAEKLEHYLNTNTFWGSLRSLKPALEAQLKRLQVNSGGLNSVEQKLLEIYQMGYNSRTEIMRVFWDTETIYGMGDMELDIYLNRLIQKELIELN